MELLRRAAMAAALASIALAGTSAVAQSQYPNRTIKLQVPFAPGGTTDITARVIAEPLGKALGQPVVVENKAGGGDDENVDPDQAREERRKRREERIKERRERLPSVWRSRKTASATRSPPRSRA